MDSPCFGFGRLVMVVDDRPGSRLTMEDILKRFGFRVTWAANSMDALAKAARISASVILVDPFLPVVEWIMWQAKASTMALPPVVAVIGNARATSKAAGYAAELVGAKAVLHKPFTREQLAKVLAYALEEPAPVSL